MSEISEHVESLLLACHGAECGTAENPRFSPKEELLNVYPVVEVLKDGCLKSVNEFVGATDAGDSCSDRAGAIFTESPVDAYAVRKKQAVAAPDCSKALRDGLGDAAEREAIVVR